jgi:hypothetical protein
MIGFVGVAHMERGPVGVRIDRGRAQSALAARAQDAHGDLAAIGNQDLAEHETS